MNKYIFDRVTELKDKFKLFFTHKAKIKALDHYSQLGDFEHKDYLSLLKKCMNFGFLGDKESDFLGHLIDKYFQDKNYIDWTIKTRWLHKEMSRLSKEKIKPKFVPEQFYFDFAKPRSQQFDIPVELLGQKKGRKPFAGLGK